MSSPPVGEDEIRRLLLAYQQYQAQADAIVRQMGLTQLTVEGLDRAIKAVEAMELASEGQDMLVPIGAGSFVYGTLVSKDRILLNVGAGVSIEKTRAEAKEALAARKANVSGGSKKLGEVLSKIDQEMQKIQAVLSKYESEQGKGS